MLLAQTIRETADFLMKMADDLDQWADQSQRGGWSTHQVEANRATAGKMREQAAKLYRAQSQAA